MIYRLFIFITTLSFVGILPANGRHDLSGRNRTDIASLDQHVTETGENAGDQKSSLSPGEIFEQIEQAIQSNDPTMFTRLLRKQVFLSLPRIDGAYYSANQAASLIENHFSTRRVLTFALSRIDLTERAPYATGGGSVRIKGAIDRFQVYVLLTKVGDEWAISQFNVF